MLLRIIPIFLAVLAAASSFAPPAESQRWAAVDVGFQHACGLDDEGRAYCWGENGAGQLGAPTPEQCGRNHHGPGQRCWAGVSPAPVAVVGGHRFRAIRAGYAVTCGVDLEGRLLCWGLQYGREPTPAAYASSHRFRDVQETDRTVCGALAEAGGRCWKYRARWTEDAFLPETALSSVDASAYPGEVVCAVAADGRALCHGDNSYGQLGTGSAAEREGWGEVAGGYRWAELRTAPTWVCGRTTEGAAYCWGSREDREGMRDGDERCSNGYACVLSPRPMAPGVRFRSIDRGREEMCGLAQDGKMLCWGPRGPAKTVAGGQRFRAIAGGYHGWCGITLAGELRCWGWQQGPTEPTPVPPPSSAGKDEDHDHGGR